MIRINLLTAEPQRATQKMALPTGHSLTIGSALIVVLALLLAGWRYWSFNRRSAELDTQISAAQQETTRLHSIGQQVQQLDQQRAQFQQRVALIEQLRKTQTGPVHILDQISRALPATVWLRSIKQEPAGILIEGRCTSMTHLSDFVASLEASGYFKKSIEIVGSSTEPMQQPPGELIKFTIRAIFQSPADGKPPAKEGKP